MFLVGFLWTCARKVWTILPPVHSVKEFSMGGISSAHSRSVDIDIDKLSEQPSRYTCHTNTSQLWYTHRTQTHRAQRGLRVWLSTFHQRSVKTRLTMQEYHLHDGGLSNLDFTMWWPCLLFQRWSGYQCRWACVNFSPYSKTTRIIQSGPTASHPNYIRYASKLSNGWVYNRLVVTYFIFNFSHSWRLDRTTATLNIVPSEVIYPSYVKLLLATSLSNSLLCAGFRIHFTYYL